MDLLMPLTLQQQQHQSQDFKMSYPPQQPKGRGRPRASYAQTGEFDLGLIREFRSRPALYDRSNKRFKDKPHVAQLWLQISNKLGYDVTMLRERMITLRNRYNIEKRRVENGITTVNSQWPLFETLHFLADHIRSRRSFKNISKNDDDEEPFDVEEYHSDSNGQMASIKDELEQEYDEYDCEQQLPVTTVLSIPHSSDVKTHLNGGDLTALNGDKNSHSNSSTGIITRRQQEVIGSALKTPSKRPATEELEKQEQQHQPSMSKRRFDQSTSAYSNTLASAPSADAVTNSIAYAKFHGFGEFMTHSLTELPLPTALRLVQKFTREIVQTAIRCQGNSQSKSEAVDLSSDLEEDE
ncbi:transcription factor Adf-1 [Drosophila tropicalis]|uniref:transcription factor Adf-1 n=1 Tax=Drosophila tropicalis TaxID=46794 RepID=UPI0035AB7DC9